MNNDVIVIPFDVISSEFISGKIFLDAIADFTLYTPLDILDCIFDDKKDFILLTSLKSIVPLPSANGTQV